MSGVKCKKISVDCIKNDIYSIRKGWPDYLGFVFYVDKDCDESIVDFIKEELKDKGIPFIKIETTEYEIEDSRNIWNKEKIKSCIESSAAQLLHEIENINKKNNKKRR